VAPKGGRLIVNQREAERVRAIFRLYLDHKALIPVVRELEHKGWTTKKWTTKKGRERGGKPFSKTSLFRLLTNVIYTGVIEFQGAIYDGEHEAIVDTAIPGKRYASYRRRSLLAAPAQDVGEVSRTAVEITMPPPPSAQVVHQR
jgi:site-specific DNA recombinase